MLKVSSTELQNNFGKYLNFVQNNGEIIIMKNGKEAARLVSSKKSVSFLTDSLIGVLKNDYDDKKIKSERILKHEGIN